MIFRVINNGATIAEYRRRYRVARPGSLIVSALIIQPMCVMDE